MSSQTSRVPQQEIFWDRCCHTKRRQPSLVSVIIPKQGLARSLLTNSFRIHENGIDLRRRHFAAHTSNCFGLLICFDQLQTSMEKEVVGFFFFFFCGTK